MKLISLSVLSLVFCLSLQASPLDLKGTAKITKNEAEHIALKRYAGARVKMAQLETVNGKPVWSLEIAKPNSQRITKVGVDATTGRLVPVRNRKP